MIYKSQAQYDSYKLILEPYCEHCPNFDVEVDTTEIETSTYGDTTKYWRIISCKHADMCDNIYSHILQREIDKEDKQNECKSH